MRNTFLYLLLVLTFICATFRAKSADLNHLQNLTVLDGLTHNGVTSILEDNRGYIWVGTYDGLNRYDGYEFKVFKNDPENRILSSNRIITLEEDNNGSIWIGGEYGLTILDPVEETFQIPKLLPRFSRLNVVKIKSFPHSDHIFCLTEKRGLLIFDTTVNFLKQFPSKDLPQEAQLTDMIQLDSMNYLLSSSVGLIHFNFDKNTFKLVLSDIIKQSNTLISLNKKILFIESQNGLAIVKIYSKHKNYKFQLDYIEPLQYRFKSMSLDSLGHLWLGTARDGLIQHENVHQFINREGENHQVFHQDRTALRISSINASTNSGCWIGSLDKGIYRFDLNKNPFKSINMSQIWSSEYSGYNSVGINEYDNNKALLSGYRGSMALLNTETGAIISRIPEVFPFKMIDLVSFFVDKKGDTWAFGLRPTRFMRLKKGQTQVETINLKTPKFTKSIRVRFIQEDRFGTLWFKFHEEIFFIQQDKNGNIVQNVSLEDHPVFKEKLNSVIRFIYADPRYDFVWIGTNANGLFRIHSKEINNPDKIVIDQFIHDPSDQNTIPSSFVSSILRLPTGGLWIGTEGSGICKVEESDKDPSFKAYYDKHGLSNNVVKNILYDNASSLWISTNVGLNKFDLNTEQFRQFRKDEGLPFVSFLYDAVRLENGTMLFAGKNEVCYFKPSQVLNSEPLPRLEFAELRIFNKNNKDQDLIGENIPVLNLGGKKNVTLKHNENVFSIQLTSLHFSATGNRHLKYQLLPISESWIEIPSHQRNISYSGLQPGKYELRVMASNSLNQWTQPKSLYIEVKPPFWQTIPAFILYFILLVAIITLTFFYILQIRNLKHHLEIEQLEKEKVKAVNQGKLRFFSNISHEIKTPLTLIAGPIEILAGRLKANPDLSAKLQIVQRQSKRIAQLVDQVHDFQRTDANKMKLYPELFCMNGLMHELLSDFEFLAQNEKKHLSLEQSDEIIFVEADKDKLEKILNNIVSNAFKYTKQDDFITIKYHCQGKNLLISVTDTGKGIETEDLPHIFERFYQSKKQKAENISGSGIGLAFSKRLVEMHFGTIFAESKIGKGTSIHISLPVISENKADNKADNNQTTILNAEKQFDQKNSTIGSIDLSKISVSSEFSDAKLFFAEDNAELRNFVSEILSKFFIIKSFENGKACLDHMENEWPDLILSDVLMPGLNGLELCNTIKSDIKTCHIPVILLTACTTIEDQVKGLNEGADAYMVKPFNITHLISSIESLLKNRKQLQERFQMNFPLQFEKSTNSDKDALFLKKLFETIDTNLDNQDLGMDEITKGIYMSRSVFYQKVKALTNETPFELLKNYRLKKAAQFLAQERYSVNEVYSMTGFKSRSHFSKIFKEIYNVSPGKYASELKKEEIIKDK